ncbi:hypothetical protein GMD78_07850 [Ornithinibacillus sp. L9]|uniref:Haem-binding uptake Tiki superfamily ChaN domain-containing protein n=1 Tax=Ornithinibacillus caprae TaxID=2678566 RepID=A0A6N8FFG5_9BACI|nr:DUF5694 domain-containing protein [Ornithinibacillus caprae]MUK88300.1 hypothetical protein [Ornithinibacillus caprae]
MKSEKPKILVFGTFHMFEHEGLDSIKRQTEIEELVSKIAQFKPTKIAVEMVPEDSEVINEKYRQYKLGTYKLEMNEIFQVGFRLGLRLGHEQIYPTDWMGESEMDYGEVESWAKENQPELLNEIYEEFEIPELTDGKSIVNYYKELNEPSWLNKLHKMYVNLARVGDFNNYIGMKWLSWWYKRNLIMFGNLTRLIESDKERILFIVGSSHSTIVNKFLEESDTCEVVQPLGFLS